MMQIPPETVVRTADEAADLASRNVCLQCNKVFTEALKKGLCPADYQKYRRAREKAKSQVIGRERGEKAIAQMDAVLIAQGLLLADARSADDANIRALEIVMKMNLQTASATSGSELSPEEMAEMDRQNREANAAYAKEAILKKKNAKLPPSKKSEPIKRRKTQ